MGVGDRKKVEVGNERLYVVITGRDTCFTTHNSSQFLEHPGGNLKQMFRRELKRSEDLNNSGNILFWSLVTCNPNCIICILFFAVLGLSLGPQAH